MLTFTWEPYITKDSKMAYISWNAVWDGRHDNDPLYEKNYPWDVHPFVGTLDYIQEGEFKEMLETMTEEEKNRDHIYSVVGGGTFNMGNYAEEKPEDHDPENLREIGDVVADNPVTRAICEMLSKPEEIEKHSGNVTPECYRNKLLIALVTLWD